MIKRMLNALAGALVGATMGLAVLAWMPGTAAANPVQPCQMCASPYSCQPSTQYTDCMLSTQGGIAVCNTGSAYNCQPL